MIKVENLKYAYPDTAAPAVNGVSFSVASGEIFGFLGPSGAGKSTTQKLLIGLLKGYEGNVEVLNRPVHQWSADFYEKIGVSFELPNHYLKLTARENLDHFRSLYSGTTEEPDHLLELVELQDAADRLVSQFSKGMKMRLNVVRALLHRPPLLFFDEPTSGLDPVNARRIKDLILDLKRQGRTIFLTTHDMNVADELCDRVGFIVDGRIAAIDAPRTLKLAHGRRAVEITFGHNGSEETVTFPLDGLGENEAFLRVLRDRPVQTIHTQEPTLEQIFIDVTGRTLA